MPYLQRFEVSGVVYLGVGEVAVTCEWTWEKPPSTHNYRYLEIPILNIWNSVS